MVLFAIMLVFCQGVYGDNGSLVYHHGYGYAPYGPYSPAGSPVPAMGNDGQLYGPQHYQYPPYFQPLTPTSGPFTPTPAVPPQGEVPTSVAAEQKPLPVEAANANSNGVTNGGSTKGNKGAAPFNQAYQCSSFPPLSILHMNWVLWQVVVLLQVIRIQDLVLMEYAHLSHGLMPHYFQTGTQDL